MKEDKKGPKPIRTKKFRTKIFKIFLLVSLIPLLITSISSLLIVIKTRQQNIAELQNLAIDNAHEKITKFLKEQMEGFNLVVSGAGKLIDKENAPKDLTKLDPNDLILFVNKKIGKQNFGQIEELYLINKNGLIISKVTNNNGSYDIAIKKYFPNDTIFTYSPEQYKLIEDLGSYNTSDIVFETAFSGKDYFSSKEMSPNLSKITIASQIKNLYKVESISTTSQSNCSPTADNRWECNDTIGVFIAEINIKNSLNQIYTNILKYKSYTVNTNTDDLINCEADPLIELAENLKNNLSLEIASTEDKENEQSIINKIVFFDKSAEALIEINKIKEEINLKRYFIENPTYIPAHLNFVAGIESNYSINNLNNILAIEDYSFSPFTCQTCDNKDCTKCKDDKYVIFYYAPLLNNLKKIIGYYAVEIDLLPLNQYITTIKPGDAIKNLNEVDPNNLVYFLKGVFGASGNTQTINFIHKDGTTLGKINSSNTILLQKEYLEKFYPTKDYLVYKDVEIEYKIDDNAFLREDFKTAIYGENFFGTPEFYEGNPNMKLASQIENEDRVRIGVVSARVDLNPIKEIINKITLGNTGFLYVVDSNGYVITCSSEKFASPGDNLMDISLVKNVIYGKNYNGLNEFTTYKNPLAEEVVFSGRSMLQAGEQERVDWFILSEWPRDDAFSVIDDILRLSLIIALGTLVLIIILGLIFTQQIVKPIHSLSKGAQEISKGNLDYRIELKTKDEFELLRDKFNEMVKVLKDNRRLRDEFVFISAHELRTPVTAIKGYLSMILDETFGPVPREMKGTLDIVNSSNERLVQLVHDLLEIARSEAGKMEIAMSPVPIYDSVKVVINELKSLSDAKGIKLSYNEKFQNLKVSADPNKLKEVLVNIIGNAIKYTRDNGDINVWHELKGKSLVTNIQDHGIGLTEEEVSKLFSKFYRAQNEETKDIEGTGLGLFICKEIIERMNGKIWVTSKKGEGSTFSFNLEIV